MDGSVVAAESEEQQKLADRERELRDDAEWKRLQRDTFERWLNEQLRNGSASSEPVDLMVLCAPHTLFSCAVQNWRTSRPPIAILIVCTIALELRCTL